MWPKLPLKWAKTPQKQIKYPCKPYTRNLRLKSRRRPQIRVLRALAVTILVRAERLIPTRALKNTKSIMERRGRKKPLDEPCGYRMGICYEFAVEPNNTLPPSF